MNDRDKFIKNPNINPYTGRSIIKGGKVYNKLLKQFNLSEDEGGKNKINNTNNTREEPIDYYLNNVNIKNVDKFIILTGMILMPGLPNERVKLFRQRIINYDKIFNRKQNLPTNLKNIENKKEYLENYTDIELEKYYNLKYSNYGYDREKIIAEIIIKSQNNDWYVPYDGFCNNSDTFNTLTLEHHPEVAPTDENNDNYPMIGYGIPADISCYSTEELEASLINNELGTMEFVVPDATADNNKDRIFPYNSIFSLNYKINNKNIKNVEYNILKNKLNIITENINKAGSEIKELVFNFNNLSDFQKSNVLVYFAWMFLTGMWARKWEGLGYGFPLENIGNCQETVRNYNVMLEKNSRQKLLDEFDDITKKFIDELLIIRYNFEFNTTSFQNVSHSHNPRRYLKFVIDRALEGDFCMLSFSDIMIENIFYYVTLLFNISPKNYDEEFNKFLQKYGRRVIEIDSEEFIKVLDFNVNTLEFNKFINLRLDNSKNEIPYFYFSRMIKTTHYDPKYGYTNNTRGFAY